MCTKQTHEAGSEILDIRSCNGTVQDNIYTSILELFFEVHLSSRSHMDHQLGRSTREHWQWLQDTRNNLWFHSLLEKLLDEDGSQCVSEWDILWNKQPLLWSCRSKTEQWCYQRHTTDIRGLHRLLHLPQGLDDSQFVRSQVLQSTNRPFQNTKGSLGFSMETSSSSWPDNWLRKLQDQGDSLYEVGGLQMLSRNLN